MIDTGPPAGTGVYVVVVIKVVDKNFRLKFLFSMTEQLIPPIWATRCLYSGPQALQALLLITELLLNF